MCMDPSTWPQSSLYSVISAPLHAGLCRVREKFCSALALRHPQHPGGRSGTLRHWYTGWESQKKVGKHLQGHHIQPLEALGLKSEVCSKGFQVKRWHVAVTPPQLTPEFWLTYYLLPLKRIISLCINYHTMRKINCHPICPVKTAITKSQSLQAWCRHLYRNGFKIFHTYTYHFSHFCVS